MNRYQEVWWQQARADHDVLLLLRGQRAAPCHQIHYLQMVTEKVAKARFWRAGTPPPRSHAGFVQFLRSLGGVRATERQHVADVFEFRRFKDFQNFMRAVSPLAYSLERLAPALAQDGPNPEYPWPQHAPEYVPATFDFDVWTQLTQSDRGRHFLNVITIAINRFPAYG